LPFHPSTWVRLGWFATLDLFESYYLGHAAPQWADTAARMRRIVADKAPAQP